MVPNRVVVDDDGGGGGGGGLGGNILLPRTSFEDDNCLLNAADKDFVFRGGLGGGNP